jgi:hypothetical protein
MGPKASTAVLDFVDSCLRPVCRLLIFQSVMKRVVNDVGGGFAEIGFTTATP